LGGRRVNTGLARRRYAVVIPAYNRADLIARAVESALRQERPPDEIIVVDDGSTDDTSAALGRFGSAVTYLRKEHEGVSTARNLGVAHSNADFVAFLDSDDFWDEGHLRRVDAAIEATNGEGWLYFADLRLSRDRDDAGTIWDACGFGIGGDYELRSDGREWALLPRQPMMIPASVIRRDAYISMGGSAQNLTCRGDTHLFFKLALAGPVCAVAGVAGEATADDPARLTEQHRTAPAGYWECTRWLYADILARHPDLPVADQDILRRRLADAYLQLGRMSLSKRPLESVSHVLRAAHIDRALVIDRLRSWRR
jgi:glycosyltransferase involved in cell wall biosynthesis